MGDNRHFFRPDLDTAWMRRGACWNSGVDFHPEDGAGYVACRAVCEPCPVRGECLNYAIEAPERLGCWGGLSPRSRGRIAKGLEPLPEWARREKAEEDKAEPVEQPLGARGTGAGLVGAGVREADVRRPGELRVGSVCEDAAVPGVRELVEGQ